LTGWLLKNIDFVTLIVQKNKKMTTYCLIF
jgi:hypothetical protein